MPHVTDQAICVRHWDFSETSQTVSLFCREHGIMRGLAKGARRAGGRFSGGIDLVTLGQVVAITKPGRDLATVTDWTLLRTWRSVRASLPANQSAYYMIDLVQRLLAPADPHPGLFDALVDALDQVEACHPAEATLRFQWTLLDELGYRPRLELPAGGDAPLWFSPEAGGTVAAESAGAWKVRRPTLELLAAMSEERPPAAGLADGQSLVRANRLLAAYVRHILGMRVTTMALLFPEL